MLQRLKQLDAVQSAGLIAVVAFLAIAGAWIFEAFGYLPCELCLKQRFAYYYGIPLAVLVLFLARQPRYQSLVGPGFAGLALIFAANSVFGVYHAGVEWHFWAGPSECTGAVQAAAKVGDFLKQLETVKVVRCDVVALRIFGLSLAGWNALISAALALVALNGARTTMSLFQSQGSSSLSQ